MTLSFSEKLDGKPTHFVNKIWIGFARNESILGDREALRAAHFFYFMPCVDRQMCSPDWSSFAPKIHTIRADEKSRWRVGMPIHFVIRNRTPNRFQFAPILPVKAIQEIKIRWCENHNMMNIWIDGVSLNRRQILILAKNDGFENEWSFSEFFNSDFDGKIIHWTEFTYSSQIKYQWKKNYKRYSTITKKKLNATKSWLKNL